MSRGLVAGILRRWSGGRLGRRPVAEAHAARDRGDWGVAADLYRLALTRRPELRYLRLELGAVLRNAGRIDEAFEALAAFVSDPDAPPDGPAERMLALLLARSGNLAAAAFHARRAAALGVRESLEDELHEATDAPRSERAIVRELLERCERHSADIEGLSACARRLSGLGETASADVFLALARLRTGFAASALGAEPAPNPSSEGAGGRLADNDARLPYPGLQATLSELGLMMSIVADEPAGQPAPAPLRLPDARSRGRGAAEQAGPSILADAAGWADRLETLLLAPPEQGILAKLGAALADADRSILLRPPKATFGSPDDLALAAGRVAWNNLRDYLAQHRHLAFPPAGSARLLRAVARFDRKGLGPYLHLASRIVARGSDTLVLPMLASPHGQTAAQVEAAVTWLGMHLDAPGFARVAPRLGELGLKAAMNQIVSRLSETGDLDVADLKIIRDAYIGAGEPAPALQIQAAVLTARPDDDLEKKIASRLAGLVDGVLHEPPQQTVRRRPIQDDVAADLREFGDAVRAAGLAPELLPVRSAPDVREGDALHVVRLGTRQRSTAWGTLPVLCGIEAIRIRTITLRPPIGLKIVLDGRTVADLAGPPPDGRNTASTEPIRHTYNAWIDVSAELPGPHVVDIVPVGAGSTLLAATRRIIVDPPTELDRHSASDSVVVLGGARVGSLEEQIDALPSVVRSAGRSALPLRPERILVVRADQLGDLVASVPAIQRLREMLPDGKLYGLVTPANEALARSLGLFEDVVTAELAYSHTTKRRHMDADAQAHLQRRLASIGLDLAIDLSPGPDSRPLLRLSGAPCLVGFKPAEFPWLTFGIDARTHDPVNLKERASHATLILTLVEALGAALGHRPVTIRHPDARREDLARFGPAASGSFAVLHAGARIDFKRWPFGHYLELGRLIIETTDLGVILLSDDADHEADVVASGLPPERLRFQAGHIPAPALEALLAFCEVFVGNDTGPKHLAALRGAKVVSVHMGQVNWDEWGQEGNGLIVSRRVPCCGCGIDRIEDCGKQLACLVNIRPAEVYEAAARLAGPWTCGSPSGAAHGGRLAAEGRS